MKAIIALVAATFLSLGLSAQIRVTGNVTDGSEPVIGATVVLKGTSEGTVTDIDGNFSLSVPSANSHIVVSYVGMKTLETKVGNKFPLNIVLQEDNKGLDEVVVVGYGTMKKSDLSGSVGQIKSEDLMKGGALDLAHGMQGKMAGVQINQSDGAPGAGLSITVRGANSFTTSSQPLYIVDGVPFETGSMASTAANENNNQSLNALSYINPHDIESIEVLKDASATAIYGSRGANGVVLITTKRGSTGKPRVDFSANMSVSTIAKKVDFLDAYTYAKYINEEEDNSRFYEGSLDTSIPYAGKWDYSKNPDGTINYKTGKYNPAPEDFLNPRSVTDEYGNITEIGTSNWLDEITQTGMSQEYNIGVSGGNDTGFYSFSGNYAKQEGIIKHSDYERYALRVNIGKKVFKWLELGTNTSYTNTVTNFAKTNSSDYSVIRSALIFPPTYGADMTITDSDELNWLSANPAAYVRSAKDEVKGTNWFSSSYLEAKITPWLKFRQNLGLSHSDNHRSTYYDRHTQEGKDPVNGKAGKASNQWDALTLESLLTLDKKFGVHSINAVVGHTYEYGKWDNVGMVATNFPDDMTKDFDMSRALDKAVLTSDYGEQKLESWLGRVNYTLMDKYLLTMSVRSDGSSKFTSKNKWATFLSGAIAWRASEEKFIKDLNIFSNLKFRASYGETGNQGIGSYRTKAKLSAYNYPFDGNMASGMAYEEWRGPVSSDLKWETTAQIDAGVDMGFLKNRLTLTVDFYHKKTRDLLQEVKIPLSTGFSNMMTNSGHVTNTGWEFSLNYVVIQNAQLTWSIMGNLSFNKNKIGGLKADQFAQKLWNGSDQVFIQRNGCPIGALFGYVEDGFFDNEEEVRAFPQYATATDQTVKSMVGEVKYRDIDKDGKITTSDRVIIGDTNPDYTWGVTNNLSWKNFHLSFLFTGSHGNDIYNGNLLDVTMGNIGNIPQFAYDSRWTAENANAAKWPRATAGYSRNMLISDRYVEDGSYIRLKNVSLSYDWRRPLNMIENVKFTFTASNLFTITDYSWFDPDVNAFGTDASRKGVDIYSYPSARTFSFGVDLTF
ncbi:MAG: SusC/RagA family TonB-linked outer membrane protein [Prevotella sp.]